MRFQVEREIWDKFPDMSLVVAYGKGLDNSFDRPEISERLRSVTERLKADWGYPNAQSHPYVAPWRPSLKMAGISPANYPCAIESLCRQVISGREIHDINPLVNFYNVVSLDNISPVGGWDVGGGRSITLRRTRSGEPFTELGKTETVFVNADEISYTDGHEILTRHFVWRQSECAKITHQTEEFFLVSEVLPALGPEAVHRIEQAFAEGAQEYFGVRVRTAVLKADSEEWPFDTTNRVKGLTV
jgi:DNA/RNA-binding domain of Phe-tRNA-synthetase-like protein